MRKSMPEGLQEALRKQSEKAAELAKMVSERQRLPWQLGFIGRGPIPEDAEACKRVQEALDRASKMRQTMDKKPGI